MQTHLTSNRIPLLNSFTTMSSQAPNRKVLLIGATGSIGSIILSAILSSPNPPSVTILKRTSSTSPLPPSVPVISLPSYDAASAPLSTLVPLFKGFDAIISCQTTLSVSNQLHLIDAAIQAGVKRYFPSEYGLNNMRSDTQSLCPVFKEKGTVQRYLRDREDRIEWTSVSCGTWLGWSFANNFLGLDVKNKKVKYWDDGEGRFSITTEENTAAAVVRAVTTHWDETRNRNVFLSDVVTSQREIVDEIERQIGGGRGGVEKFAVEKVRSEEEIERLKGRLEAGEGIAVLGLIEAGLASGKFGTDFEKEEEVMNERLGLASKGLAEIVREGLASLGDHMMDDLLLAETMLRISVRPKPRLTIYLSGQTTFHDKVGMVQEYDAVRGVTRPLSESEPALCSAWSRRQTKNSVRWVIPLSAVVLNRANQKRKAKQPRSPEG
ncbi:hypothetical protein QBC42DRAFT_330574 [Cladorrhinum samala]|uniref:NmrA-like domain-containing protein n=1 Tax=Cladorrhinum samala TaxID=585594 RepID=A0AAV9HZ65_9PEZI|nr:hypothetical protein QBC42DRAFT_330574 [Cladorrhinum samala]